MVFLLWFCLHNTTILIQCIVELPISIQVSDYVSYSTCWPHKLHFAYINPKSPHTLPLNGVARTPWIICFRKIYTLPCRNATKLIDKYALTATSRSGTSSVTTRPLFHSSPSCSKLAPPIRFQLHFHMRQSKSKAAKIWNRPKRSLSQAQRIYAQTDYRSIEL